MKLELDELLRDELGYLIDQHGLHSIVISLIDLMNDKVDEYIHTQANLAKRWERCIHPAKLLERRVLRELG
jgi:hypothetical protein